LGGLAPGAYALLAASNNFSGNLGVSGTATARTVNATTGFDLGDLPFAYGSFSNGNVYFGFAGNSGTTNSSNNTASGVSTLNSNTTGSENTASGYGSLAQNTTGSENTASGVTALSFNTTGNANTATGWSSLYHNTTGMYDTASGSGALYFNTIGLGNVGIGTGAGQTADSSDGTGSNNTAVGANAVFKTGSITNATAIGAQAEVDQSNTMVLGCVAGVNSCPAQVNVGIGTATPRSTLELVVSKPKALGPVLTLTNSGGGPTTESALDFNSYLPSTTGTYNPGARILAYDQGDHTDDIYFQTNTPGADNNGLQTVMVIHADGVVSVPGTLEAGTKDFKIDHPLDPANKFLVHASVESSEMMNIYSGNVITDELGLATIKLPDWFEAENTDFRYQLTTIGRDAHAWIAKKVQNRSFQVATDATNVEVSWQITAVRQDAYAKAHPLVVEQEKSANERGFYAHPELYGQPIEKQIGGHAHDQPASAVDKHFAAPARPLPPAPAGGRPLPHPASSATKAIADVKQP
jgi:trimeric autotransporter adhesin